MDNNGNNCITTQEQEPHESGVTYSAMVQLIALNTSLTKTQKRDMISAVRRAAEMFSPIGLEGVADIAVINGKLKKFSPAMAGMQMQTFANWKSLLRRAFKASGLTVHPGKNIGLLAPIWANLLEMIPDAWDRRRLGRFAHFASPYGWSPADVSTQTMVRYLEMLEDHCINGNAREGYVQACNTWNKLCECVPDWPGTPVEIVRSREPYMVKLSDLAPLLKSEINGYLEVLAGGGDSTHEDAPVFLKGITRKSLSPVTIDLRRTQILQYVSALVAEGFPLETLHCIDVIAQVKLITAAMDFFYSRAGDQMATQIQFIAIAVRGLLYHHLYGQFRHRVRQDKNAISPTSNAIVDPRIKLLDDIIAQSRPTDRGLRTKNKRCLNQFDDPRNVKALLHLPSQLLKEATKVGLEDGARLAETALAIELLLMCPIRIGNLVGLDLDRHFIKSKPGKKAVIHIVIPRDEVKNDREIEFELPEHVARMLELHIEKWRPLRPGSKGTFLFPAGDGGPRLYKLMSRTISGVIHRHTGLSITPHQFRHIAGKLFLEANPNGHETVRQVLGHASIDTTTQHYTGIDQVKAGKTFDKAVLALRESTKLIASKRRPQK